MTSIHMSNAHMVEIAVARFSCCPQMTQSAKVQFSSYTVYDHIVVDTSHLFHLLTKKMTETVHFPLISVYCPHLSTKQSMSLPSDFGTYIVNISLSKKFWNGHNIIM